jgi:hypothetical protein
MKMFAIAALAMLALAGCKGKPSEDSSAVEIQKRASALQRAADQTTDNTIKQIEASTDKSQHTNQSTPNK